MFKPRAGFNLIEVMVAMSVAATVLLAMGAFIASSYRSGGSERDRAFAMQRAMQMMEEIAAYVPTGPGDTIARFDQGAAYSFQLTTEDKAVAYNAVSGNPKINNAYKYVRHITVADVPSDTSAKQVTVEVYYANRASSTPAVDPKHTKPLAVISNHMRLAPGTVGTSQVLDLYVISIENMPHIFRKADDTYYFPSAQEARLAFEQSMRNFTSSNPGISLRPHFITRLSIGRDPQYRPYVNYAKGITTASGDPLKWVYTYPGKLDSAPDGGTYYDPGTIQGNIGVGDGSGNVGSTPGLYPLADQFNNCVPYAQEFNTAGNATGSSNPIIPAGVQQTDSYPGLSLRQFLEDLLQDTTGKYKNAVVVNLHGELFPALPLRPYADAAKDPTAANSKARTRRMVLNSYRLGYTTLGDTTKPIRLLMHFYNEDGSKSPDLNVSGGDKAKNVWMDPSYPSYAREARVRIKGIKPYLKVANGVRLETCVRERKDGPSETAARLLYPPLGGDGGSDEVTYKWEPMWDLLANTVALTGGDEDPTTPMHSGPHLSSAFLGSNPPHWDGNDFVFDLKDIDYDCRQVKDDHPSSSDGKYHGIKTDQDHLLYQMQYFPDPILAFLDKGNDSDKLYRNTARLRAIFTLDTTAAAKRFEVVTQFKKYNRTSADTAGTSDFLDYVAHPSLIDDPTISRSYFYAGVPFDATNQKLYIGTTTSTFTPTIPWTDQVQLVGDPRHNPYEDLRLYDNLNTFWTNFTSGNEMYKDVFNDDTKPLDETNSWATIPTTSVWVQTNSGMSGMSSGYWATIKDTGIGTDKGSGESYDSWNTVKYNAPAYFRMWREAIYRNSLVMVNVAGQPFGYIGLGGEFSLKGSFNDSAAVMMRSNLYDKNDSLIAGKNELALDSPYIYRQKPDPYGWIAKPWLGELYPTFASGSTNDYTATYQALGNLPTGGDLDNKFRREDLQALANADWDLRAEKTNNNNTRAVANQAGLGSFLNAGMPQNVKTSSDGTSLTTDGTNMMSDFNLALSNLKSSYPYKLFGSSVATPEYVDPLYTSLREDVDYLDTNPFFDSSYGSGYHASHPILLRDGNGVNPFGTRRGVFLASAFRAQNIQEMPKVFDNAVAGTVQSFFDMANPGLSGWNLKPPPRVELTSPSSGATFTAGSGVTVSWNQAFQRADRKAYSRLFTYSASTSPGSGGPFDVAYFVKYKNLTAGTDWQMAKIAAPISSNAPAPTPGGPNPYAPGVVPPGSVAAIIKARTATTGTANWDTGGLPAGDYLVRLEAYRYDSTNVLGANYAFHELKITLQ